MRTGSEGELEMSTALEQAVQGKDDGVDREMALREWQQELVEHRGNETEVEPSINIDCSKDRLHEIGKALWVVQLHPKVPRWVRGKHGCVPRQYLGETLMEFVAAGIGQRVQAELDADLIAATLPRCAVGCSSIQYFAATRSNAASPTNSSLSHSGVPRLRALMSVRTSENLYPIIIWIAAMAPAMLGVMG